LHHFTEYANFKDESLAQWKVPYHHGTFYDFEEIDFNQLYVFQDIDDDGDYILRRHRVKHRFDMVIFSNFLTEESQVERLKPQLYNCIKYLRNNGILIVVGARAVSEKYSKAYEELNKFIQTSKYSNWKFVASCKKIDIEQGAFNYFWSDFYGIRLKELIRVFVEKVEHGPSNPMSDYMKMRLEDTIQTSYDKEIRWEVTVFKKTSKIRINKNA